MGDQWNFSGKPSGFHMEENSYSQENSSGYKSKKLMNENEDLIFEENTIYEIDRECYERLKKQKKRRS